MMRLTSILVILVSILLMSQLRAQPLKKETTDNIFYDLAELTYLNLESINLQNQIKIIKNKDLISDNDLKKQEEKFACTNFALAYIYKDFLNNAHYQPRTVTLVEVEKKLKESGKVLESNKINCDSTLIDEGLNELFKQIFPSLESGNL